MNQQIHAWWQRKNKMIYLDQKWSIIALKSLEISQIITSYLPKQYEVSAEQTKNLHISRW